MAANGYSSGDIDILEGLEAVRVRPGMYIGSTGVKGLHHILWEIVDNAIDEAANGYADTVSVILYKDGSASVEDNGRGIPTDIHPKAKVSGVQVVFTQGVSLITTIINSLAVCTALAHPLRTH